MNIQEHVEFKPLELLETEIEELKHEIKQTSHMNNLNRSVIQMLSETKLFDNQLFYKVIVNLLEQIDMQSSRIKRYMEQKNQMAGKIYLLERIAEQINTHEKLHYQMLVQQLEQSKAELAGKSFKLKQYEQKIGEIDYLIGFATKTINIFDPSEQTLRFNEEIASLQKLILMQQQTNQKLAKENQGIIKINMALKAQIQKKNDQISRIKQSNDFLPENLDDSRMNQSHRINASVIQTERSILPKQDTSFAFLRFQKTLVDEDTDSDFDPDNLCPQLAIMFPEKVQKINKRKQLLLLPKLNMQRVRIIMKKNRRKMDQQLKNNIQHVNPTQKIIQIEAQLQGTRRELSKYILKQKEYLDLIVQQKHIIQQLQGKSQLLVQSTLKYQQNWKKLYKQFAFYKNIVNMCQQFIQRQFSDSESQNIDDKFKEAINSLDGISFHRQKDIERIVQFVKAMSTRNSDLDRPRSGEI